MSSLKTIDEICDLFDYCVEYLVSKLFVELFSSSLTSALMFGEIYEMR